MLISIQGNVQIMIWHILGVNGLCSIFLILRYCQMHHIVNLKKDLV